VSELPTVGARLRLVPAPGTLLPAALLLAASLLWACSGGDPSDSGDPQADARSAGRLQADRPNIVLIVADDLGYSDLGVLGSEIPTPNIDRLAAGGMLLTQFYANMACSPTRAMLMSGTDSHIAGLGVMGRSQHPLLANAPGYEAYLNFRVASLANLMTDAGYHTYMTGKWHLGRDLETGPRARGFEQSFISIDGAAHLGGLSWNGPGLAPYRDGEEMTTVTDEFYSTRFYTQRMIEYLEADRDDGQPFFAYLAYTAPHWPLQAPAESIARFEGWYDDGYEALYDARLARAKELGIIAPDFPGQPLVDGQPRWRDLSAEERRVEARKMEIYAAMVSDLDRYIGQFIEYLDVRGELDNTLILFMSDNGPEAIRRDLFRGEPTAWVRECCDNRYENLGAGDSYVAYGPNWARAGSVPFRRDKTTAFEGGIRVPAIAWYPSMIDAGTRSDELATVMDILPTFLELAGTEHPGTQYRGRNVAPVRGRSLVSMLSGDAAAADPGTIGWELLRHSAVRNGDWKLVWDQAQRENARWQLFNVAEDPGELNDLRAAEPERFAAMLAQWDRYSRASGVVIVR
jgi:arylsulfatase